MNHVLNRGDGREPILKDDDDRERFVATLDETCAKTGWQFPHFAGFQLDDGGF